MCKIKRDATDEIEITPEMIDVAVSVLDDFNPACDDPYRVAAEILRTSLLSAPRSQIWKT